MRIDPRAGSKGLIRPLRKLGVQVEEVLLRSGDVEIVGEGPEGPMLVGIEYKSLEDALTCMRNGRFADQLRAMRNDYDVTWLLIEGRLKDGPGGLAIRRGEKWFTLPGRVTYQEFAAWVSTMCLRGGALLWRTETKEETVTWIRTQALWWMKEYGSHNAHLDWYQAPLVGNPFETPSYVERVANVLPGLGSKRAKEVAKHFKSVKEMCCVSQEEWCKIPGVGEKVAAKVIAAIEEGT